MTNTQPRLIKIRMFLCCRWYFYSIDIIPISMSIHPKPSPSTNRCSRKPPMTAQHPSALNEPSLADAIVHIERWEALRLEQRSHWTCSMRFVARALDRPPSLIPARWMAVRPRLEELHPSQLGVTPKTFASYRANVRAALNLFCAEKNVSRRGTPLSGPWSSLWASIDGVPTRKQLSLFLRYLSAQGISPEAVDDPVVDAFLHDWGTRAKGAQRAKPATARSRPERLRSDYSRMARIAA